MHGLSQRPPFLDLHPLPQGSAYMLALYSDGLRDPFVSPAGEAQAQPQSHSPARRVEIKRSRRGAVFGQGAETKKGPPLPRSFALCSSRPAPTGLRQQKTSLPPVSSSVPCHAAKFKPGPAKWFGLIALVTVSVAERQLGTSLLDWAVSG